MSRFVGATHICCCPWVARLGQDDLPQLVVIPLVHRVLLLPAGILVQVLLLHLPLHVLVVAELALVPLLAVAGLVERAEHRLRIDAEGDLLRLHRLEQRGLLLPPLLLCELLLFTERLLLLLLLRCTRLACRGRLLLDALHLLLDLGGLVFLRASVSPPAMDPSYTVRTFFMPKVCTNYV